MIPTELQTLIIPEHATGVSIPVSSRIGSLRFVIPRWKGEIPPSAWEIKREARRYDSLRFAHLVDRSLPSGRNRICSGPKRGRRGGRNIAREITKYSPLTLFLTPQYCPIAIHTAFIIFWVCVGLAPIPAGICRFFLLLIEQGRLLRRVGIRTWKRRRSCSWCFFREFVMRLSNNKGRFRRIGRGSNRIPPATTKAPTKLLTIIIRPRQKRAYGSCSGVMIKGTTTCSRWFPSAIFSSGNVEHRRTTLLSSTRSILLLPPPPGRHIGQHLNFQLRNYRQMRCFRWSQSNSWPAAAAAHVCKPHDRCCCDSCGFRSLCEARKTSPQTHRTPLTKKAPQRVCDYQSRAIPRMLEIYPPDVILKHS